MAILLATGIMNVGVMALVAAAVTGERVARATGLVIVGAGLLMIVRAAWPGKPERWSDAADGCL